jgi:hypothetical protein
VQHLGKTYALLMVSCIRHSKQLAYLLAFLKMMENEIDAFLMLLKSTLAICCAIFLQWYCSTVPFRPSVHTFGKKLSKKIPKNQINQKKNILGE